jgi:hypothetical protein
MGDPGHPAKQLATGQAQNWLHKKMILFQLIATFSVELIKGV